MKINIIMQKNEINELKIKNSEYINTIKKSLKKRFRLL